MNQPDEQKRLREIERSNSLKAIVSRLLLGGWRRVENLFFWLVLAVISLYFILQTPAIQNWLIQKVAGYLTEELKTEVKIRAIDFEFFDNLVLEGIFIADQTGDTLLFADQLVAGLNTSLFDLATGNLEFNEIRLRRARFHISTYENRAEDNFAFIRQHPWFKLSGKPKKKSVFSLKVKNLDLLDVEFRVLDEVDGHLRLVQIPRGHIRLNEYNTATKLIDIQEVTLNGLSFWDAGFPEKPLPEAVQKKLDRLEFVSDSLAAFVKKDTQPMVMKIRRFELQNGRFRLDKFHRSPAKNTPDGVMDFNHLDVGQIHIDLADFEMTDGPSWDNHMNMVFAAKINHFNSREQLSGFDLSHFEAERVTVSDTLTTVFGMKLQTAKSSLTDSFSMRYSRYGDFLRDFNQKVEMDAAFKPGSKLALADLAFFDSSLGKNGFFKKNQAAVAELSGKIYGSVNRLKGRQFELKLGPKLAIEADFRTRSLANSDEPTELDFKFRKLTTDMATLREVIPGFNVPSNFDKLGDLNFEGHLVGFASNFVVDGELKTDVGPGTLNMQLDLNEGREKAKYSGDLAVRGFELGRWLNSDDFGKTTFSVKLENGNGLTGESLKADLRGTVETLDFGGYTYRNLTADGSLDRFKFNGRVGIEDKNLNFSARGVVDFQGVPEADLSAELTRLDLQKLHFSPRPMVISGKLPRLRFQGKNWSDIVGEAILKDIRIAEVGRGEWTIPQAAIGSIFTEKNERRLFVESSLGNLNIEGKFDPRNLLNTLTGMAVRFYPEFSSRLGIVSSDSLPMKDAFRFSLNLFGNKDFASIFNEKIGKLAGITVVGQVDGGRGFSKMNVSMPSIRYDKFGMDEVFIDFTSLGPNAALNVLIGRTLVSPTDTLAPISIEARLNRDTLGFALDAKNLSSVLNNLSLSGQLFPVDSVWQVSFDPSNFVITGKKWQIEADNFLRFGTDFVQTKNFQVRNGERVVSLNSKDKLGMILSLNQFDLAEIHNFWKYRNLTFDGNFEVWADVDNVFKMEGIKVWFSSVDTVTINRLNYGFLNSYAEMRDLKSPLELSLDLVEQKSDQSLAVRGIWLPPGSPRMADRPAFKPGNFDLSVTGKKFPLAILETFIPGISTTTGQVNLTGKLWGSPSKLDLTGRVKIIDGWTKIDYLGTRYHLENQSISLSSHSIAAHDTVVDAIGILRLVPDTIRDERGRPAIVTGGITHDHFKNWHINLGIESDDFLVLKTTKNDNPDYYGTGQGKMEVQFGGTFSQTTIEVTATTGAGSRLFIPLSETGDASEVSFVRFKKKEKPGENAAPTNPFVLEDLAGLSIDMNLSITREAEVQLIFDEAAGDIIRGRGHGDLGIGIDRQGNLKMYGDYVIDQGDYLFTYFGLPFLKINKPFAVSPGGQISWGGDPYGATINLNAEYKGLTTSPYNFVSEEVDGLANPSLTTEARKSTRVDLLMKLSGALFKPDIAFDLQFPDLTGELKTAAENKLRIVRQDPNEMSRQAFGLIVIGGFLPSNAGVQGSDLTSTGINTLSQMVTSQLSSLLSSLAGSLSEGSFIQSIDFDLAYNQFQAESFKGRELAVRLSSSLADDRVRVNVGSNFGLGGGLATEGFQGEDVVVEIRLTRDRRWVFKGYQKLQPDPLTGGRKFKLGGGLSFRREYDSFGEMFR